MTVLVTGATGFMGQALAQHLKSIWPGKRIIGAARRTGHGVLPLIKCDFQNWHETRSLIKGARPKLIFHCAGTTLSGPPGLLYASHVTTTAHLLRACEELRYSPRIVLIGSASEYGSVPESHQPIREDETARPQSIYGQSKFYQTVLAQAWSSRKLNVTVGRIFNVLAPDLPSHFSIGHFSEMIRKARRHHLGAQTVGPLQSVRDFVSIHDVCHALVALGLKGRTGEVYNICSGVPVRMKEILREMMRVSGSSFTIKENVRQASPRSSVWRCVGSPNKIKRHTGWTPKISWQEAVAEIVCQ